jgi:ketosteroid isomerase-like protein/GNAT superfamily N-acetyltransferase
MSSTASAIAIEWLDEMESCVRAVDFGRCRAIFADDVVGFGTRTGMAVGLDTLEQDQWRHIWGRIRNFTFNRTQLHCAAYGGEGLWLACPWTSESRGPDGEWRARPGRITAVLEKRNGRWLAVHTHHSVVPDQASQPIAPVEPVIRRAQPGESAALGALTVRSKAHWGYDEAFMRMVKEDLAVSEDDILNDAIYVLEQNGRALGYCHLRPAAHNEVLLESLFVEPAAIGLGAGRRLFEFAAQKGRQLGFDAMIFESDPHAEPFYLAMGATRTGQRSSTLVAGRVLPLMRFDLTAARAQDGRERAES